MLITILREKVQIHYHLLDYRLHVRRALCLIFLLLYSQEKNKSWTPNRWPINSFGMSLEGVRNIMFTFMDKCLWKMIISQNCGLFTNLSEFILYNQIIKNETAYLIHDPIEKGIGIWLSLQCSECHAIH